MEDQWPPRIVPGGHLFAVLNVSINNTPVFVPYVVLFSNTDFKTGMMCLFFANYRTPAIIKKEKALNMVSLDF